MLEEQVLEEIFPDLEKEEDIRIPDIREEHWRDVYDDNTKDRSKVHALRFDIYMKGN